jgi:hypothetical protein
VAHFYLLGAGCWHAAASGSLRGSGRALAAPPNDAFASATRVTLPSTMGASITFSGTNVGATRQPGEALVGTTGKSIWFKYVPCYLKYLPEP